MFFVQIQVRYKDGSEGLVDSPSLEDMIASGKISHFRRSQGWVNAAGAEMRGTCQRAYSCNERRRDILSRQTGFRPSRGQDEMRPALSLSDLMLRYWCMMRGESSYWLKTNAAPAPPSE
jgi:hypothetical protein